MKRLWVAWVLLWTAQVFALGTQAEIGAAEKQCESSKQQIAWTPDGRQMCAPLERAIYGDNGGAPLSISEVKEKLNKQLRKQLKDTMEEWARAENEALQQRANGGSVDFALQVRLKALRQHQIELSRELNQQ